MKYLIYLLVLSFGLSCNTAYAQGDFFIRYNESGYNLSVSSILKDQSGEIYIAGRSNVKATGIIDSAFVGKLNLNGKSNWSHLYKSSINSLNFHSINKINNRKLLCTGVLTGSNYDAINLTILDTSGAPISGRAYSPSAYTSTFDFVNSTPFVNGRSYVWAVHFDDSNPFSENLNTIFRVDSNGSKTWVKNFVNSYGRGAIATVGNSLLYTDGEKLLKIDTSGNILLQRSWSLSNFRPSNPQMLTLKNSAGFVIAYTINGAIYVMRMDSSFNFTWIRKISRGTYLKCKDISEDSNNNIYLLLDSAQSKSLVIQYSNTGLATTAKSFGDSVSIQAIDATVNNGVLFAGYAKDSNSIASAIIAYASDINGQNCFLSSITVNDSAISIPSVNTSITASFQSDYMNISGNPSGVIVDSVYSQNQCLTSNIVASESIVNLLEVYPNPLEGSNP